MADLTDLTHLAHRVPDGQGHPAEAARRHAAEVAEQRHELAALVYVDALAAGDEGAAARHLATLRHDAEIDPWRLLAIVTARALRMGAGTSRAG